jgi:hypothetical protein
MYIKYFDRNQALFEMQNRRVLILKSDYEKNFF